MTIDPASRADSRYGVLWHSGPVGAFVVDTDGNWQAVNARWQEITGLTEEEALRESGLRKRMHPDDVERLSKQWSEQVPTGAVTHNNFRFFHPELGLRYVAGSTVGLRDENGHVTEIVGTLIDETDRRNAESALRDSEELHRLAISNLPGCAVGLYDRDMRCLLMDGIESRGLTTESAAGKHITELVPPEVMQLLEPAIEAALAGKEYSGEFHVAAGDEVWQFQTAPYVKDDKQIAGFLIVAQDVTEQRRAEAERSRASTMFRAAFDKAPIGMAIVSLEGRFERVNTSLEQLLGMSEAKLAALDTSFEVIHRGDRELARASLGTVIEDGSAAIEMRLVGADGRVTWVDTHAILVQGDSGVPRHILMQLLDVTERHEMIARLEHLVEHDPLTGLLNRRGFSRALTVQMAASRRYGKAGALLLVDLDGFKEVNDTLGHAAGDEFLVACSNILMARLRTTDLIARLGGDEFAVILSEQGADEAASVANDLIAEIADCASHLSTSPPRVTASVGISSLTSTSMSAEQALLCADRAMYQAKKAGRNRVVKYAA